MIKSLPCWTLPFAGIVVTVPFLFPPSAIVTKAKFHAELNNIHCSKRGFSPQMLNKTGLTQTGSYYSLRVIFPNVMSYLSLFELISFRYETVSEYFSNYNCWTYCFLTWFSPVAFIESARWTDINKYILNQS